MEDEQKHGAQPPITLRYDPELEAGRYLHVPSYFVRSERLSAPAKVLYMVLCSYAAANVRALPSMPHIAQECRVAERALPCVMDELVEIGLIKRGRRWKHELCLLPVTPAMLERHLSVMGGPDRSLQLESELKTETDAVLHIPLDNTNQQIQKDSQLLAQKLGISKEVAVSLAHLAADRGCSMGYVSDVVEYALTTPCIKNPAGCAVALIRSNERRRAATHLQQQAQETRHGLDPEKYTSGKYAFLFRPRVLESTEPGDECQQALEQEQAQGQVQGRGAPENGWGVEEADVEGDER